MGAAPGWGGGAVRAAHVEGDDPYDECERLMSEPTPGEADRFTGDELRTLLTRILAAVHDGRPATGEQEDRIEEALRRRRDAT